MISFKQFSEGVESFLSFNKDDVDYYISERPDSLFLHKVVVNDKKQGIGTDFMKKLISYADASNKRIELDPSTDFGASSKARLIKFYKKFGFVENKGRNKDYQISAAMYRDPK